MANNLLYRSLVDKIYISASSQASSTFNERDLKGTGNITGNLEETPSRHRVLRIVIL